MRASAQLLSRAMLPEDLRERIQCMPYNDTGHGYDPLGMHPTGVAVATGLMRPLYERWFRVRSTGHHHIPTTGPVVLAANHSGTLPFDGMMIWTDLVRRLPEPRVPRVVLDRFVSSLPYINLLFTRAGAIGGSRGDFHAVLDADEMILVFPEGVEGIGKPFSERYQLQRWTEGHAEVAIRHRAPIVPVAVIGAEEQMPQLARLPLHLFNIPYLPLTLTPFPMPVRYHLRYGPPIPIPDRYTPDQALVPEVLQEVTAEVKAAVQALIEQGLAARTGVFR
jgi:1-acyl-sn-glycerol-3-phosphate acyltransferase